MLSNGRARSPTVSDRSFMRSLSEQSVFRRFWQNRPTFSQGTNFSKTKLVNLILAVVLLTGGLTLNAQEPEEESNQLTHAETIAKALADLDSTNIDTRVGSIMLLGKYEELLALSGVVIGLSDKHVRVR